MARNETDLQNKLVDFVRKDPTQRLDTLGHLLFGLSAIKTQDPLAVVPLSDPRAAQGRPSVNSTSYHPWQPLAGSGNIIKAPPRHSTAACSNMSSANIAIERRKFRAP